MVEKYAVPNIFPQPFKFLDHQENILLITKAKALRQVHQRLEVNNTDHTLLGHSFGGETVKVLFENELKNSNSNCKHKNRYSNDLEFFHDSPPLFPKGI